ncbi:MAG: efflux RND transporter permease subunit, partial [Roseovarius sp.]
MTLTGFSFQHRHAVAAAVLLVVFMGLIGFMRTPTDLFPDTFPPQVVIITVWPGAGADDVSGKITEIVEKEVNTLGGIVNIRSTSRDQVSSVSAEFTYAKDPGQAILDVQNAIARIQSNLPTEAQAPRIYRLSDASARPLLTLSLSPQPDTRRTLSQIRLLAENQIQNRLLRLEGVADVEIFGAHQPEVRVRVARDTLAAHALPLDEVITALAARNISAPAGNIYTDHSEYLVRVAGEFADLQDIADLPIRHTAAGLLRVSDIATVELTDREPRSLYHGNGHKAIAMGIIKPDGGNTVAAIERVKNELVKLRTDYPDVVFDITQDQQPLIDLNMKGMVSSIVQAVLLTVVVIFLFLAQARAALIAGIAIPLSFLFSFIVLWLTPYTLNMITLSGLIVATGMVVDAAVVALENIDRHFRERKDCTAQQAAREGTQEIALAITAGMLTTVAVLVPIILIGGYPGRTIGRLSLVIAVTMIASLIVALTVVPLLAARLLCREKTRKNILERAVQPF